MKKFLGFLTMIAFAAAFASCNTPEGPVDQAPIIIDDAAVGLADKEFGMYYGDMGHNGIGVYSIVLSDAVCHRDGYGIRIWIPKEICWFSSLTLSSRMQMHR